MYTDIHNHILPCVDDGATSMEDALGMAMKAVAADISTLLATPHRRWGSRKEAEPKWVAGQVLALQTELDSAGIPLRVEPGLEIPVGPTVAADLHAGIISTLGNRGYYALLEPSFDQLGPNFLEYIKQVRELGIGVVLAHPERAPGIQADIKILERLAKIDVVFQLTSGSILGHFGENALTATKIILERADDWTLVIASDSHNQGARSPEHLRAAIEAMGALVGETAANAMVTKNPQKLLSPV